MEWDAQNLAVCLRLLNGQELGTLELLSQHPVHHGLGHWNLQLHQRSLSAIIPFAALETKAPICTVTHSPLTHTHAYTLMDIFTLSGLSNSWSRRYSGTPDHSILADLSKIPLNSYWEISTCQNSQYKHTYMQMLTCMYTKPGKELGSTRLSDIALTCEYNSDM